MTLIQKLFGSKPAKEEPEMTNIQKALELIGTFASGDTEKAKGLLAEEMCIRDSNLSVCKGTMAG